jgi:hypothetical protein
MKQILRLPLLLLLAALLAATFLAYLRPGLMLDLANQLWLCL